MNLLINILLTVQIFCAFLLIVLVLIQHGKGADMGAAFGSGSSGSLFGASGSANFLSRTTAVTTAIFFATTLALAYFEGNKTQGSGSILETVVPKTPISSVPPTGVVGGGALPLASTPVPSVADLASSSVPVALPSSPENTSAPTVSLPAVLPPVQSTEPNTDKK